MAQLVGHSMVSVGSTTDVHTIQSNPVGLRSFDVSGNEYIYMQGVASVVLGTWVVYD